MRRILINMERYAAGTPAVGTHFRSRSTLSDLAYARSSSLAYLSPSSEDPGDRVVLHNGPDTDPDQACEAVIDRACPSVSGDYDPLGLILAWTVSAARPSSVLCTGGTSAPAEFFGELTDDDALGENNHLRISVGAELEIIQHAEDPAGVAGSEVLWSMPLTSAHRRLALRAGVVEGEVVLWWNPDGLLEFEERPLARVHTVLSGASKLGLFSGRDGRFLAAQFEYRSGAMAQPVAITAVEEPDLALEPVLLVARPDLTRPPAVTMMQVSHYGDTRMPERQARTSRLHPRSGRFLLRPGHSYVARAVYRNVDGDVLSAESRPFNIAGEAEDLELRDCLGRRIAPPGDEGTDEKSDIDLLVWPPEIECGQVETSAAPGRADLGENMDVTARGVQRASLAPRLFSYPVLVDDEGRRRLLAFLAEARGRTLPFIWTNPMTAEVVICRFTAPTIAWESAENDLYNAKVAIAEEPRCLGEATPAPSPGYSIPGPDPDVPVGACCLADGSCAEVSEAACAALGGDYKGDFSLCAEADCSTGGGGGPPFDCETECGDGDCESAVFDIQTCIDAYQCPATYGAEASPLCGCFTREVGACSAALCVNGFCMPGGHVFNLFEYWCCFESGPVMVYASYTGSPGAFCCAQAGGCLLSCDQQESTCCGDTGSGSD